MIQNGQLRARPVLKVHTDTSVLQGLGGITFDPNFSTHNSIYNNVTWIIRGVFIVLAYRYPGQL